MKKLKLMVLSTLMEMFKSQTFKSFDSIVKLADYLDSFLEHKSDSCVCVKESNRFTVEVIKRHIDTHKFQRHIKDPNEGIGDFIKLYQWAVGQVYCSGICMNRGICGIRERRGAVTDADEAAVEKFVSVLAEKMSPEDLAEARNTVTKTPSSSPCQDYCPIEKDFYLLLVGMIVHDINDHKWLRHIPDLDKAVYDFLEFYFWIIKDVYFHGKCIRKEGCEKCPFHEKVTSIAPDANASHIIAETLRRTGCAMNL